MADIPRAPERDGSIALLREGYRFIGNRCDRLDTDAFTTRLMLRKAICMRGEAAARLFYTEGNFTRHGAMPWTTLRLLQGPGSVQTLDGAPHRHRKAMFAELLTDPAEVEKITRILRIEMLAARKTWQMKRPVVLMDELPPVLTSTALTWLGIPRDRFDPGRLARVLIAMIENASAVGPSAWVAIGRRRRVEWKLASLVRQCRGAPSDPLAHSPFGKVCFHRDMEGELLSVQDAVVETLNLLRPIVAVSRFIAFGVVAARRKKDADEPVDDGFAEEVRRISPFFPFVAGRSLRKIDWNGYRIEKGAWVLLDLYGTNHLPRLHPDPDQFDPERGLDWREEGFSFIPQGGGSIREGHRCPGEAFTVAVIAEAVRLLLPDAKLVGGQDLTVNLAEIPARPKSGVLMEFQ